MSEMTTHCHCTQALCNTAGQ